MHQLGVVKPVLCCASDPGQHNYICCNRNCFEIVCCLDENADCGCHAVEASSQRYVPPAARTGADAGGQLSQLQRRVRGLLNRLSDSNLASIVADVIQLAEVEGERAIANTVTAELLQVCDARLVIPLPLILPLLCIFCLPFFE